MGMSYQTLMNKFFYQCDMSLFHQETENLNLENPFIGLATGKFWGGGGIFFN